MSVLGSKQIGKDGIGKPLVLNGIAGVRLKAKSVTAPKQTTLKITGNSSGATYTIDILNKPGEKSAGYNPPPVGDGTSGPVSSFTHSISNVGGNGNTGQQNNPPSDNSKDSDMKGIYNNLK